MLKLLVQVVLLIAILLYGTSCTNSASSQPPKSSNPATSSSSDLFEDRIPTQSENYYFSVQDALPQDLPPQLLKDDETAYRLALAVRNFLCYRGNTLEDFDGRINKSTAGVLETAVNHTSPLQLNYSYGLGEGFVCEDYPDHPITKRIEALIQDGQDPMAVFYADDVRAIAKKLFGEDVEYQDADVEYYRYFPEERVYIQFGELTGARLPYPQIISYTQTENGYQCDVVLVSAHDKNTPIKVNGTTLTKENFEELTASKPKYRYTVAAQKDEQLILVGLETLS